MSQLSSFLNIFSELHPKNRLLKYSKCSKLSYEKLQLLLQIRKIYRNLPPIVYSIQDYEENQSKNRRETISLLRNSHFEQILHSITISSVNIVIYQYENLKISGDQHHSL